MAASAPRSREAVVGPGIDYGYGNGDNQAPYRLGESPIGAFLKSAYDRLGSLPAGTIVVDLGSGAGRFARHAPPNRQWRWFGVDHDPAAVAASQEILKEGDRALVGDITKLDSLNSGFGRADAAVSHRVLHALPVEYHLPILRSAAALLPPDGDFFLSAASNQDWKAKALQERGVYRPGTLNNCKPVMFDQFGVTHPKGFDMHFFSVEELGDLAQAAGFRVVSETPFQESTGYQHLIDAGLGQNEYWGLHLQREPVWLQVAQSIGALGTAGFNSPPGEVD